MTWALSPMAANDFRFNYSRTDCFQSVLPRQFWRRCPCRRPAISQFVYHSKCGIYAFKFFTRKQPWPLHRRRMPTTCSDKSISWTMCRCKEACTALKFGIDFRRLSPQFDPAGVCAGQLFLDVPSTEMGTYLLQHSGFQPSRNLAVSQLWASLPKIRGTSFHD